jgi:hypothetical protein
MQEVTSRDFRGGSVCLHAAAPGCLTRELAFEVVSDSARRTDASADCGRRFVAAMLSAHLWPVKLNAPMLFSRNAFGFAILNP